MKSIKIIIGECVKKRRNELRMSQMELAEKIGKYQSYISIIEKGNQNISVEMLQQLAIALDVNVASLVENNSYNDE